MRCASLSAMRKTSDCFDKGVRFGGDSSIAGRADAAIFSAADRQKTGLRSKLCGQSAAVIVRSKFRQQA